MQLADVAGTVSENGNTILLGILAYLAVEIRSDVRKMREQVGILWAWYQGNVGVPAPENAYPIKGKR